MGGEGVGFLDWERHGCRADGSALRVVIHVVLACGGDDGQRGALAFECTMRMRSEQHEALKVAVAVA